MVQNVYIRNMVCPRCVKVVKEVLTALDIEYDDVVLGQATLVSELAPEKLSSLRCALLEEGFDLLDDRQSSEVESIRLSIIAWARMEGDRPVLSEYLQGRCLKDYSAISKLFSQMRSVTVERYALLQRVEYAKELISYGDRSFSEISWILGFGIPLPLCSCGVIPTAMSLRKEGASKGATVSFLIATPQTGVDSIIATYSLMGLPFAIVRPIAALCTSLFGGALVNVADKEAPAAADCRECERPVEKKSFAARCVDALQYAYVEMMEDIGKWLVIGLVVAGLITVLVPDGWFTVFKGNTLASMLLVLVIAMPMYVCATGSIPIAVALMLKGLTPGAALVLLMAGPACNFASMIVVRKVLGMKTTVVYMLSIVLGAICFGFLVDYLQFSGSMDFLGHLSAEHACCHEPSSWFAWTCTGALLLLLINALVISRFTQNTHSHHSHHMESQIYHIEGMNCNHCRMSAEKALLGVEGVTNATVDLASKEAHVEGTASRDALAKAISEIGFTLVD